MQPVRPPLSAGNNSADNKPKAVARPTPWMTELGKFINKPVTVRYLMGDKLCEVQGNLRTFRPDTLHCVVDTETETFIIRLPLEIIRKRRERELAR